MPSERARLQREFKRLDAFPDKIDIEDAKKRGLDFEALIQDLFVHEHLLMRRAYHTSDGRSEQIDGALLVQATRALLEVKWVKPSLAASELFSFAGKVENKFVGTIGLFVSRTELTPNFLSALRRGRRQCVMVVHGDDVDHIFDPNFPIAEYISGLVDALSFDNLPHLPAAQFLKDRAKRRVLGAKTNPRDPLVARLLSGRPYENVVGDWIEGKTADEVNALTTEVLEEFLAKSEASTMKAVDEDNMRALVEAAVSQLPQEECDADVAFFEELSRDFSTSPFRNLTASFGGRLAHLDSEKRKQVCRRLRDQWEKALGDYNSENTLAEVTEPLIASVDRKTRSFLLSTFLEFIASDRRDRFPQVRLAKSSLMAAEKAETTPLVRALLKEKLKAWDEFLDNEADRDRTNKWYARQYKAWERFVNGDFERLVGQVIDELRSERA